MRSTISPADGGENEFDVRKNLGHHASAYRRRASAHRSRTSQSVGERQRDAVPECAHLRWQRRFTFRAVQCADQRQYHRAHLDGADHRRARRDRNRPGNGRTLMPGLIDAHWHAMLIRPNPAQAIVGDVGYNNIAAGVEATDTLMRGFTTVRDVGGPVFGLKTAIDAGLIAGPRIYPSGAVITV